MAETFTKLAGVTLPSAYGTITFSSISQNYSSLVLVGSAKSNYTTAYYGVASIQFNSTGATTNYNIANYENNTTSVVNQKEAGTSYFRTDFPCSNASNSTYEFSSLYMTINKYNTSAYKPVFLHNAVPIQSTNLFQDLRAGTYNGTSAVTSIIITSLSGNFTAGTTYTLYGIGQDGSTNTGGGTVSYA